MEGSNGGCEPVSHVENAPLPERVEMSSFQPRQLLLSLAAMVRIAPFERC
jgi:hypothetical protein